MKHFPYKKGLLSKATDKSYSVDFSYIEDERDVLTHLTSFSSK